MLDRVVDVLLSRGGSVALALTDAAVRVGLPDDPRFAGVTGLPMERETVLDFVLPADRMVVVDTWERARLVGMAYSDVQMAGDPDRAVTFTVVDVRHRYGVWLGFLNAEDRWASGGTGSGAEPVAAGADLSAHGDGGAWPT